MVDTVNDISKQCDSPKLGTTLGHYLKQISMVKKSLALISGDENMLKQATDFGTLFDTHCNSYVSAVVNRRIKLRTINKDVKIPQTNDLVVFKEFLDEEIRKLVLQFPFIIIVLEPKLNLLSIIGFIDVCSGARERCVLPSLFVPIFLHNMDT